MIAVPRLYEVMRRKILRTVPHDGWRARLFAACLRLGRRRAEGRRLGPAATLADRLLDRLVRAPIRAAFGGRLKAMVSGGAPLDPDLGLFFAALGLPVLQGYGQTETAPVVSCNPPGRPRMDTVGPPLANVEVRLAEDGELCVRGESVMSGYWNDPEATARVMPDGIWVHTGDIGAIDPDGYIRITDRKKDIIVTSGGDTLSPQRIEGRLSLQPEIAQIFVFGDRHPHLVALIVPGEMAGEADIRQAVGTAVERVNATLTPVERIRRFALCDQPFTVENGMLTPTLKIRRHVIRETYAEILASLYESAAPR
jgi:long-chain acyl-CoA synthetase